MTSFDSGICDLPTTKMISKKDSDQATRYTDEALLKTKNGSYSVPKINRYHESARLSARPYLVSRLSRSITMRSSTRLSSIT